MLDDERVWGEKSVCWLGRETGGAGQEKLDEEGQEGDQDGLIYLL